MGMLPPEPCAVTKGAAAGDPSPPWASSTRLQHDVAERGGRQLCGLDRHGLLPGQGSW